MFCVLVSCQEDIICASPRDWKEFVWLGLLGNTEEVRGAMVAVAGSISLFGILVFWLLGQLSKVVSSKSADNGVSKAYGP